MNLVNEQISSNLEQNLSSFSLLIYKLIVSSGKIGWFERLNFISLPIRTISDNNMIRHCYFYSRKYVTYRKFDPIRDNLTDIEGPVYTFSSHL